MRTHPGVMLVIGFLVISLVVADSNLSPSNVNIAMGTSALREPYSILVL